MESRKSGPRECVDYEAQIEAVEAEIAEFERSSGIVRNPQELEALELGLGELLDRYHGLLVGRVLQRSLDSEEVRGQAGELVKGWPKPLRNDGYVQVKVRTARGTLIPISVVYYRRKGRRRAGRRERGLYAALVVLGCHGHLTPGLASQVSAMTAVVGSLAEAQKVLSERGVKLDIKTVRAIAYGYAARAKAVQQVEAYRFEESVAGRRVVVATDGGRLRVRQDKRGRKTAKGRTRYSTRWREPKLLIIYVVNAQGKLDPQFAPFIDGTLNGPDAVFGLLRYYLGQLGLGQAERVLFVADGAHWIWNRVPALARALGLSGEQFHERVDFYHAVEHLGQVAALRKGWSQQARKAWVRRHRKLLLNGQVDAVVKAVQSICRGRNSQAIATQRDYFIRNRARMDYAGIAALHLPIGSGAIESAVRRVINLRLKGASIYWRRENAEALLTLRAYYKSGRWNLLKSMANSHLSLLAA
jgi:hypothetical protein